MATGGKRILIVDDSPEILEVLEIILDIEGYEVKCVDNGNDIAGIVADYTPNLILMDIMLGEFDGRDLCRLLKSSAETESVPVVMISASHNFESLKEKSCYANGYVSKPFNIDNLVATVAKFAS